MLVLGHNYPDQNTIIWLYLPTQILKQYKQYFFSLWNGEGSVNSFLFYEADHTLGPRNPTEDITNWPTRLSLPACSLLGWALDLGPN